jgi:hypothetical protein
MDERMRIIRGIVARYISKRAEELYDQVLQAGHISIHGATPSVDVAAATDLENYGFLFRQAVPAGYDLFPTPLAILILSLLNRLEWSYPPFVGIPTEEREHLKSQLMRVLEILTSETPQPDLPTTSLSLEGAANIDAFVTRILAGTRELCVVSADQWSNNLPLIWAALVQQIKRGMQYRRLISPLVLAAFGWEINNRDMTEIDVDLRVSLAATSSPFYIFTGEHGRSALVFFPVSDGSPPRAVYIGIGQLTEQLLAEFNKLWRVAVPAGRLLARLKEYRGPYLERAFQVCGEAGARVAARLFDEGIFAKFTAEDTPILCCLLNSGLAITSNYTIGLTKYAPNIIDEITRYIHEEGVPNDH